MTRRQPGPSPLRAAVTRARIAPAVRAAAAAAQVSHHPIYDATVRDHGFDPRAEQIDNGITHARENRKDER